MLTTIFSYKKNSYPFSKEEKEILLKLLNFFKFEIPNGNGSFLSMLDLEKIEFMWCPKMALDDSGIFGSWILTFPNTVFVRPSETSKAFIEKCSEMKLSKSEQEKYENFKKMSERINLIQFKSLNLNQDMLKFVLYLCESDGVMLSTLFHELYHKWQYNVSKPLYIINFFLFLFTGYEFSTKNRFSIEGDVRIYIDNEGLHQKLAKFYSTFYSYIFILNKLKTEKDESVLMTLSSQLNDLENSDRRNFEFSKKLVDIIKA